MQTMDAKTIAREEQAHPTGTAVIDPEKGAANGTVNGDVEPQKKPQGMTFPDGGKQAWLTVVGAWLVLFSTFGFLNGFGVFQDYYQTVYLSDHTPFQISWIGSFQLFLMFALAMPAGILFDHGYFKYLLPIGSVGAVFSIMMISLAKDYYNIFLAQGVALGISFGLLFNPSIAIIGHYFMKRRALAMGIAVSGSSTGGVIFPIMLNKLFNGSTGFAWGVRASGFLIAGCLLIANLLMKTRLPPFKQRPPHMQKKPDIKAMFRDVPYLIEIFGLVQVSLGLFTPFFYSQIFAQAHGVSGNLSFYTLSIINAASIFGRVLPNFLADKFGPLNIMVSTLTVCGILIFVWLACTNVGGTIAFSILFGFWSGGYVSTMAPVNASFASSPFEIGARIGIAMFIIAFGVLFGTPINGALLGDGPIQDAPWYKPVIFSGVMVISGACFVALARILQVKRKGTWKV